MADKYAHLAPRRPRWCSLEDGTPKVRMSRPRAELVADDHPGYHAYECPTCRYWHVGRDSPAHPSTEGQETPTCPP